MINRYSFTSYPIVSIDEYIDVCAKGINPLIDWKNYQLEIRLRIQIQNTLFGKSELGKANVPVANQKYYQYMWENKLHVCEECCKPLYEYSAKFISHILTRGGYSEMAHDCRNSRILCFECHQNAEIEEFHRMMKIYEMDLIIIELLKHDYNELQKRKEGGIQSSGEDFRFINLN